MTNIIQNRYEFILYFDVENGNPNGDPDAGNMPRIDPETSMGLVSDVCLKRKIRNYISLTKSGQTGYDIYIQEGSVLNQQHEKAYEHYQIKPEPKKLPKDKDADVTRFMCDNFFDVRTFGAVMTTEVNCGQVRGPVQMCFARSVDPIISQDISITRMAVTNVRDLEKERTMGRKSIVPYGMYRVEGFVSAPLAEKTGFGEEDLQFLWDSLINMFDHDRSAARGKMSSCKLFVFKHASKLGNAHAQKLFNTVTAVRRDETKAARSAADYLIQVDKSGIPSGVELLELL